MDSTTKIYFLWSVIFFVIMAFIFGMAGFTLSHFISFPNEWLVYVLGYKLNLDIFVIIVIVIFIFIGYMIAKFKMEGLF